MIHSRQGFQTLDWLRSDPTLSNSVIRGTRGYLAREWFRNIPITAKVDAYSYGGKTLKKLLEDEEEARNDMKRLLRRLEGVVDVSMPPCPLFSSIC
ncbi:hypothetical protein ACFX13_029028 [Malus domestica]